MLQFCWLNHISFVSGKQSSQFLTCSSVCHFVCHNVYVLNRKKGQMYLEPNQLFLQQFIYNNIIQYSYQIFLFFQVAVTQDEQWGASVSPCLFVCGGPTPWCYRGHALPEIFSRWTHYVNSCVPRYYHTQISGICLHKLPATSWW